MASFVQQTAGAAGAMRLLPAAPAVTLYRRSSTCKAPRKRVTALALLKRNQKTLCTAGAINAEYGGGGPNGPTSNTRSWGSGDDHFSNHSRSLPLTMSPVYFAVTLVGMVVWCMHAGPAAAMVAAVADSALGSEDYVEYNSSMALYKAHSVFTGDCNECICDGLTAEEKELLDPKQYHVREWVFVH